MNKKQLTDLVIIPTLKEIPKGYSSEAVMAIQMIVDAANENLKKSSRNLAKCRFVEARGLSVYDILDHEKLVLTKGALEDVQNKAKKAARVASGRGKEEASS